MSKPAVYDINTVSDDATKFALAHPFIQQLKKHRRELNRQQLMTLRGQALAGDIEGAKKGLAKLLGWEE